MLLLTLNGAVVVWGFNKTYEQFNNNNVLIQNFYSLRKTRKTTFSFARSIYMYLICFRVLAEFGDVSFLSFQMNVRLKDVKSKTKR